MFLKFVAFIFLFYGFAVGANAKHALIIGNSAYQYLPALDNPVNDATDIAATLTALGFSVVVELDANQQVMENAIANFGRQLSAGGVGLFYYAGHGIQVKDINYMIPTHAELKQAKDLKYKAVNVGQLLDEMDEARNGLNIVILDACRDNPLKQFRSAGRGLAEVNAPRGTLVAFATSPGSVASDGTDKNGTYTKHLLQQLKTPGLAVEQIFKRVLQGVDEETNGAQTPWTSSSFKGDFYFIAPQGNVNLVQSQAPISINEGATGNLQLVWIAATFFLLLSSALLFYFFKLKSVTNLSLPSNHSVDVSTPILPPVQEKLAPELNAFKNALAAGYLIDLKSNQAIAAILPGKPLVLGRSKSRTNVYLEDTAISAEHATVHYHSGSHRFLLEDLHSSNGCWIKGQAPLVGGIKTAILAEQVFYLADRRNAFYIFSG